MLIKSIALALLVAIVACARPTRYFEEETEIAAYRVYKLLFRMTTPMRMLLIRKNTLGPLPNTSATSSN
jgi:hypothetical protein